MAPGDYPTYGGGTSGGVRCGTVRSVIRVYLGHGASGTAASMQPWVDGLAARGIEAHAVDLPKRKAEDAVAAYEAQVPDEPGIVIGGHSFGGRVASLAVAGVRVAGAAPRANGSDVPDRSSAGTSIAAQCAMRAGAFSGLPGGCIG